MLLSPFDADPIRLIELASTAEELGFDSVWTYDHLTGAMFDRGSSNDAFTLLGAMAVSTNRVHLGPLVSNIVNRHPVRLALIANTLQKLSGGRAVIGLGSGAAPNSRFSAEQVATGVVLGDGPARRSRLIETIDLLRSLWSGNDEFHGEHYSVSGLAFGLANPDPPPIIVGASGPATARLAFEHGDGLNIANEKSLDTLHDLIVSERPPSFEVSVHVPISTEDAASFYDQLPEPSPHVDRWVFAVSGDTDIAALTNLWDSATSKLQ